MAPFTISSLQKNKAVNTILCAGAGELYAVGTRSDEPSRGHCLDQLCGTWDSAQPSRKTSHYRLNHLETIVQDYQLAVANLPGCESSMLRFVADIHGNRGPCR